MLFTDANVPHKCQIFNFGENDSNVMLHAIVDGFRDVADLDTFAFRQLRRRVPNVVYYNQLDFQETGEKSIFDKYYRNLRKRARSFSTEEVDRLKRCRINL